MLVAEDGTFAIDGLIGHFVLRMESLGSPKSLVRVEIGSKDVTDEGIVIEPGDEVSDVRVALTSRGSAKWPSDR
jgi:hypothetical protein